MPLNIKNMAKKIKFQHPIGMHDVLPHEQKYFKKVYDMVEEMAEFYSFGRIDTPILENSELFNKGTGSDTDIVQKEMYLLKSKGGDSLALRPEGTPSVARAYIEHGMMNRPQPVKLYYFGPFFRHEKPQAGRYRQFWQFGFEILGEENPVTDAQIIQIFHSLLSDIGLKNISIQINSIGDKECRPAYRKVLLKHLKANKSSLCSNCKKRMKNNPLRVLDCKEKGCQEVKNTAPQIVDHLCSDCKSHFKKVLEYLDEIELPYNLEPHLVRGLDYYTRTVFEFFVSTDDNQEEKVLALGGGGRYDYLISQLGGKETPAIGGAFGVERLVQVIKKEGFQHSKSKKTKIFLAQLGDSARRKSLKLAEKLRKNKVSIDESFGKDSLKAQLARASKVGAKYSIIIGQKEALDGTIIIRDMDSGKQETIKMDKSVDRIKKLLKK
jgi:histidyl-tRNA synthetase